MPRIEFSNEEDKNNYLPIRASFVEKLVYATTFQQNFDNVRRCTSNCKIRDTCLPNELSIYTHLRVRMRTCCIKRSSRKSYGNVSIHSASKRMQFCADFWVWHYTICPNIAYTML
ncbi:hypothetical protein GQX74_002595 [Glossina fuscipes]|nr:hypothetical protein GQX74_002595 [Glossina fuscipes]